MSQLNCGVRSLSWSRYVQVDKLWLYTASVTDGIVTDACKGDSGGPLILENGAQPLLIGVLEVTEGRWNNVKAKRVNISDGQNKNLIIVGGRLQLPHEHLKWGRKLEQCGLSEGLDSGSHQWQHFRYSESATTIFLNIMLQDRSALGEVSGLATLGEQWRRAMFTLTGSPSVTMGGVGKMLLLLVGNPQFFKTIRPG